MKRTTTFETAKVGDKVWSLITRKWHTIVNTKCDSVYNIVLNNGHTYDRKGCMYQRSHQTLFWDEVKIVAPEKPLPELAVDTPVIVWDTETYKHKAHFSHFHDEGKIVCFFAGRTSWSIGKVTGEHIFTWDNWRLADDERGQDDNY